MIRINFGENSMDYKCSNEEKERLSKILPCIVSSDIDALYTMGLVSTEIFVDGRVLFKFEDDIIIDFMMSPNPNIPYKNETMQVYYTKIKLLKDSLKSTNEEVDTFLGRIGDNKKEEDNQSLPSIDDYHILYKGKVYEVVYTNTNEEDMALQKDERAIIIKDESLLDNMIRYPDEETLQEIEESDIEDEIKDKEDMIEKSHEDINEMKELFDKDIEAISKWELITKEEMDNHMKNIEKLAKEEIKDNEQDKKE